MSPLYVCLGLCTLLAATCWLLSVLTREYSWVDRIWSIAPPTYAWIYAGAAGFTDLRLDLMAVLATVWGARLTFNYARKGGYARGGEDYRWLALQERLGPVGFQLLNATFIAPYQNALLLLFTLPAHAAWVARGTPLGALDAVFALAMLALIAMETTADEQQWRFQQRKRAALERGDPVHPPFVTTGLFRFSRHPNFFAEQAIWWCFYGFSVAAGSGWLNATIVGAVLLTLLFQGSTTFTERLSLAKYPSYADYQATTSRLVPMPPRSPRT